MPRPRAGTRGRTSPAADSRSGAGAARAIRPRRRPPPPRRRRRMEKLPNRERSPRAGYRCRRDRTVRTGKPWVRTSVHRRLVDGSRAKSRATERDRKHARHKQRDAVCRTRRLPRTAAPSTGRCALPGQTDAGQNGRGQQDARERDVRESVGKSPPERWQQEQTAALPVCATTAQLAPSRPSVAISAAGCRRARGGRAEAQPARRIRGGRPPEARTTAPRLTPSRERTRP